MCISRDYATGRVDLTLAFLLALTACVDEPSAPPTAASATPAAHASLNIVPSGYAVSVLPVPYEYGSANAINENGVIVGWATTLNGTRAVRWTNGSMVDLGTLPGDHASVGQGISNSGLIVGKSVFNDYNFSASWRSFLFVPNVGMLSLHDPNMYSDSWANAISPNTNVVVGGGGGSGLGSPAFRWSWAKGMEYLGGYFKMAEALDVNDAGTTVGYIRSWGEGTEKAYLWWPNGSGKWIGTLGGCCSQATGINASDEVVGWSKTANGETHVFRWTYVGGLQDLGSLEMAMDVSAKGRIVGCCSSSSSWTLNGGQLSYLPNFSPGGINSANAVNSCGTIVGSSGIQPLVWHRRTCDP